MYECIPVVCKSACVIVIAPLINIMAEQCKKLVGFGFKATYVGKDSSEDESIIDGQFDLIYCSHETLLEDSKWKQMLKSKHYQDRLRLIVVDEAHTVTQWYVVM